MLKGNDEKDEDEIENKEDAIITAITEEKKKKRTQKGRGQE